MGILHGKIEHVGDGQEHLVLPPETNEFLYRKFAKALQPGSHISYAVGMININVDDEPNLTDQFRGLREVLLLVRHDSLLVLLDGTRLDGTLLSEKNPAKDAQQTATPAPPAIPATVAEVSQTAPNAQPRFVVPPKPQPPDAAAAARDAVRQTRKK